MEKIGKLSLKITGAFIGKIQFSYNDGSGGQNKLSTTSSNILVTQTKMVDPGDLGVPNGSIITLIMVVVVGKDHTASDSFEYESGSSITAQYEGSGTLFGTNLKLISVGELLWMNWSQNLVYQAPGTTESYFYPKNKTDLQNILTAAGTQSIKTVRVSGQRHSQPPLVTEDNRSGALPDGLHWIVDLACYKDLGGSQDQNIVIDATANTVQVNTGVSEDSLNAFLTTNNKMLPTVSAGGFFSIGGMIAVDVNGATVNSPIFAETAVAFTIMGAGGTETIVDTTTTAADGSLAIAYARVSLGALGIITSVTLSILDRPFANTLSATKEAFTLNNVADFTTKFKTLLTTHDRVETFLNPYQGKYLALTWDVEPAPSPTMPNKATTPDSSCELAGQDEYGAPLQGPVAEPIAEALALKIQEGGNKTSASLLLDTAYLAIEGMFKTAKDNNNALWLTKAARVIFMSYFVELPGGISDTGMQQAWDGLNAVTEELNASNAFMLAGPMEFRFMKGGDAVMAGTYSDKKDSVFINLDLIGFTESGKAPADYSPALLKFFATIERKWVALGGLPHNGKMYGFYDPSAADDTFTPPFNEAFVESIAASRSKRIAAFDAYRTQLDPGDLFANKYVKTLLQMK